MPDALRSTSPAPTARDKVHRRAVALDEAAEGFIGTMSRAGFILMFPDETAVASDWLAGLYAAVHPCGLDLDSQASKARAYDAIAAHLAGLKSRSAS